MKITIIHGQNHKGSTYQIAHMLAQKLGGEITEFFLPRDFDEFCIGCNNCFMKSETLCPHYQKLNPLTQAINHADVLILASPVYVYHVTGAMKAFLDHYGYRWMVHRPYEGMFKKQAVCISTAAGAGIKSTNKDMADSLFFWGVGKIYQYGVAVRAINYKKISENTKQKIDQKTSSLAQIIKKRHGHIAPGIKSKGFFNIIRLVMKKGWNQADAAYWKEKKWVEKSRPW